MDFPLIQFIKKDNIIIIKDGKQEHNIDKFNEAIQVLYKLLLGGYNDVGLNLRALIEEYNADLEPYKLQLQKTLEYWIEFCNAHYDFNIKEVVVGRVDLYIDEVYLRIDINIEDYNFSVILQID